MKSNLAYLLTELINKYHINLAEENSKCKDGLLNLVEVYNDNKEEADRQLYNSVEELIKSIDEREYDAFIG